MLSPKRVKFRKMFKGRMRGTFEYTIDWLPVVLMTRPSVIYGFGIAPVGLKWNFLANPPHRPYAEVDFGGVLSTHSIPPGDSTINFTANAGGGLNSTEATRRFPPVSTSPTFPAAFCARATRISTACPSSSNTIGSKPNSSHAVESRGEAVPLEN